VKKINLIQMDDDRSSEDEGENIDGKDYDGGNEFLGKAERSAKQELEGGMFGGMSRALGGIIGHESDATAHFIREKAVKPIDTSKLEGLALLKAVRK